MIRLEDLSSGKGGMTSTDQVVIKDWWTVHDLWPTRMTPYYEVLLRADGQERYLARIEGPRPARELIHEAEISLRAQGYHLAAGWSQRSRDYFAPVARA